MGPFFKRELLSITNWVGAAVIALGEMLPYITPDVLADLGFTAPWVKRISTAVGLLLIAYRENPKPAVLPPPAPEATPSPFVNQSE